ncbi:MAG: hypothetical protein ACO3HV_10040 [Candidatus Nanopelagicales bacterium]
MRRWTWLPVATASMALLLSSLPAASAATGPDDLEFSYTMNSPLIGTIRDSADTSCYQSLGAPFTLEMVAGPAMGLMEAINKAGNEILCTTTISRNLSGVAISGTASASAQGQSGTGAFSLLCEVGQTRSAFFSIVVDEIHKQHLLNKAEQSEHSECESPKKSLGASSRKMSLAESSLERAQSFRAPVNRRSSGPLVDDPLLKQDGYY